MNRYYTGRIRCDATCLFGQTPEEVHSLIGTIHPTLSYDVYNHQTIGWVTFVETMGSSSPVVHRIVGRSVAFGKKVGHPYELLWCAIYFDHAVGYYRPRFLTKEAVLEMIS